MDVPNEKAVAEVFIVEANDILDRLDSDLVAAENDPNDEEILRRIFRGIHTLKGTCGWVGFSKLEGLTHAAENLLIRVRESEVQLSKDAVTVLLLVTDTIRQTLTSIENVGHEGDADFGELVQQLEVHSQSREKADDEATAMLTVQSAGGAERSIDNAVRVDVNLLDTLMNQVGELVLARNQIVQASTEHPDAALRAGAERLNLVTSELQEGVMKARMQPIGTIWNRFPRLVRNLCLTCNKQVNLEMDGIDTELDRTLIESIKDPLTHLVRNAIDHGFESPGDRAAAGKPKMGTLGLRAYHEGGQVNIEISDDGAGIDAATLKDRAIAKGVISSAEASKMSDRDAVHLIFLPGLSTRTQVTNVSGRGVGMDVVKTNIERIGGTIDIQTTPTIGTTIKLKIPLTLAIIPAVIVMSGGGRFAIPQVNLLELVRLAGDQAKNLVENVYGAPVYRLRGELLPLVYLDDVLKTGTSGAAGKSQAVTNIVVLEAERRCFGLVVDGIHDSEEIVVKPLARQLKGISVFAGATIMGDGKIALIVDVFGIAQSAAVLDEHADTLPLEQTTARASGRIDVESLLLMGVGLSGRLAMPLTLVARLEEFDAQKVEHVGEQEVIQYRGHILPLVRIADILEERRSQPREQPLTAANEDGKISVVVHRDASGRNLGLVVDRIIDIVEESISVECGSPRAGVIGSAVIQQRVTELLDVEAVVAAASKAYAHKLTSTTKVSA